MAQKDNLAKGDYFFEKRMYLEAIAEYEEALAENIVFDRYKMTKRIAQTYKMLFDYEQADKWYGELVLFTEKNEPIHQFNHALILCNLEKYEEAKKSFKAYFTLIDQLDKYAQYEGICDWAITHKDEAAEIEVLQTNIETGGRSLGIDFFKEGLVYASPQDSDFTKKTVYYDLAYSKRTSEAMFDSSEVLKGALNHSFYEGTPSFSESGKLLYYTGNATEKTKYRDRKRKKKNLQISKDGVNILYIYQSKKENGEWSKGSALSFNSREYDCAFPFILNDSRLFFCSNMEGGFGGFDLYYVDKINDSLWSAPVNLGAQVNSALDELYPYVDSDTLYYSSKGKKGFGGADIFKAYIKGDEFSKPVNVGKPYNSSKDDFSFIINNEERRGYFSSNREGKNGYDYIYEFNIPEQPDTISGLALNKLNEHPIKDLEVKLHRMDTAGLPVLEETFLTDGSGKVQLILEKHVEFLVTFYHTGFESQTFEIPAEERTDIVARFGMLLFMPIPKKNDVIKIDNIYFDYNKATIKEESFPVLQVIADYLTKNSEIRVELSAHTDSRGSASYNLRLSSKRAASVVKHLIEKGIPKSRLVPKGYGESKLVNKCGNNVECSEEEHQENRRVEMKVL